MYRIRQIERSINKYATKVEDQMILNVIINNKQKSYLFLPVHLLSVKAIIIIIKSYTQYVTESLETLIISITLETCHSPIRRNQLWTVYIERRITNHM